VSSMVSVPFFNFFFLHHLAFAVVGHGEDVVGKKVVVGNVAPVD
jgi:hypothetical protein